MDQLNRSALRDGRGRPRTGASLGAALGLVLAAACLAVPVLAQEQPAEIRLQLKWFHQFQAAGFYAAIEQGYFRDAGLDVRLIEGGPTINATDTVLAGDAEFGIGTSGLLVSRSRGLPVVAVAAIFQHSPYIIAARDDPDIREVSDLVGRRVMVEPYSEELIAYLHREGADIDDLIQIEHSGNPLDLADGDADAMTAYTTTEPFMLERAGIAYQTFDPKVAGIDFYGDTLFTTEAFARENEQTVTAFRDAALEGWRYALRHPEEVIDLIHREYGSELDREHERFAANEIRRLLIPDLIGVGYMNPARWEHIAAEFRNAGLMEREVDLDAFLFEPAVRADWTWVYGTLLAAGLLLGLIGAALMKFYALYRSLHREVQARRALEEELKQLAITDPGTGALNRRGFLDAAETELEDAVRSKAPFSLLTLDVDHFKQINDTYGHAAGDHVLAEFAAACRSILRTSAAFGRLGGEEFGVSLPGTNGVLAGAVAERIRAHAEHTQLELPKGERTSVTVSIGVAVREPGEALDALMSRADGAMYEAKVLGRNRVVIADVHQTARLKRQRERIEAYASDGG